MKTFSQYITELFDKPYPFTLKPKQKLKIPGEEERWIIYTAEVRLPDKTLLKVTLGNVGKKNWDLDFARDGVFNMTGQGDQIKIFSTVIGIIKDFINKEDPDMIMFTAEKKDTDQDATSREKLYNRMINKFSRKMGYKVETIVGRTGILYKIKRR